jgi:hypothetical protein
MPPGCDVDEKADLALGAFRGEARPVRLEPPHSQP